MTLVRKDKDAWTLEPGGQPADPTEVRSYLSSLRADARRRLPRRRAGDLAKYGLDTPRLTVTVVAGKDGADSQTLLLGKRHHAGLAEAGVRASAPTSPTVYAARRLVASARSTRTPAQFRDKTVLGFDAARVGTHRRSSGRTARPSR